MYQITLRPRSQIDRWRALAEYWHISEAARQKLEWLVFYYSVGKQDAAATAKYFGISRKTFHKWKARFNPQVIQSLEEKSRAPIRRRTWEVSRRQEQRIIKLRNQTKRIWGKAKLQTLYQQYYKNDISTWKIERVIRKHKLYPDLREQEKKTQRLKSASKKTRIHQARKAGISGPLSRLVQFSFLRITQTIICS
jgi:transposase